MIKNQIETKGMTSPNEFDKIQLEDRWSPVIMPQACNGLTGPHANLIYACSDTLRRFCESLWYSGLEFKRPTDEEIMAKCGILFYQKPVPQYITYAFFYQLENLFAMSKVIYSIRSIMDWLDAIESRSFQMLSIYDLYSHTPNFVRTMADHVKALWICDELLDHLGSIYLRIRPMDNLDSTIAARAVIDFQPEPFGIQLKVNQCYSVLRNHDPHVWQISYFHRPVPSLFLELSNETGEKQTLHHLRQRFDDFLIMCHGRSRRQLYSRVARILQHPKQYLTLYSARTASAPGWYYPRGDGFYFARYPEPAMRWKPMKSSSNNHMTYYRNQQKQRGFMSSCMSTPDDDQEGLVCILIRLRSWLRSLVSPGLLLDEARMMANAVRPRPINFNLVPERVQDDDIVDALENWYKSIDPSMAEETELKRVITEAKFIKNLNEILQTTLDFGRERILIEQFVEKPYACKDTVSPNENHPGHAQVLMEELVTRLGEQFYHPRCGQFSYRWMQRPIDRSTSPLSPKTPMSGRRFYRSGSVRRLTT